MSLLALKSQKRLINNNWATYELQEAYGLGDMQAAEEDDRLCMICMVNTKNVINQPC